MALKYAFIGTLLVATGGFVTLTACSSDDGPGASSGTPASDTVTVRVTAANGGTVEDKSGKAKLAIPAGALEKDTDITLKISPKSGNAVVEVADFGPDGLKFLKPATLELKADPALAGDKSLALAIEEGGTFKELPGSSYANGVAKADIEHFTRFSVILVDGKVTLVVPEGCQDARAKFVPCGGDPTGTWAFAEFCPDPSTAGGDLSAANCPQLQASFEVTNDREVTITGSTIAIGAGTETDKMTLDFPLSCVPAPVGETATCDQVSKETRVCSAKSAEQCHCEETKTTQKAADEPKSYSVSGTTWTNNSGKSGEYCVSGDVLYYREDADANAGLLYVLKRKR